MMQNQGRCGTYGDNLRSDKGEGSLGDDAPPSDKPAGGSRNVMVLNEWTRFFPVTETNSEANVRISNAGAGVKCSCLSWSGPPPRSRMIPRMMRPIMVKTLMELM